MTVIDLCNKYSLARSQTGLDQSWHVTVDPVALAIHARLPAFPCKEGAHIERKSLSRLERMSLTGCM